MTSTRLAYVAVGVAILGWASLHPVAKGVVESVGAVQTAFDRAFIAAVVLGALAVWRLRGAGLARELRWQPAQLFLYGLLSFAASSLLAMAALRWLPADVNVVLNNMGPLWLALAAAAAGQARRRGLLVGGALVAFGGVVLVVLPAGVGPLHSLDWRGVALSALSSVVIAAQAAYGRRLLPGRDPIAATAIAAGMAAVVLALVLPLGGGLQPLLTAPGETKLALLYLGVGATALNFACWSFALQRLPATRALNLQNLVPPLGVLLSVVFLAEPFTRWMAVGLVLCVGGAWLAQRGALAATPSDDAPATAPRGSVGRRPATVEGVGAGR